MGNSTSEAKSTVGLDPTIDFVAGTLAGMAGLIVGFPFDTVKVRLQSAQTEKRYTSTFQAIRTIVREERTAGLYRGISSPMATCALLNGLVFASYRFFMKLQLRHDKDVPSLYQITLAGAGSGIVSSVVTTPTELIKIRQQTLSKPSTARAMAFHMIRQGGIRTLYRGLTATALRDCGYGAYFAAYEGTCRYFKPSSPKRPMESDHSSILSEFDTEVSTLSWPVLLLAGGVAGIAGWLVTFPLDVVKTRMQSTEGQFFAAAQTSASSVSTPRPPNPYRTTFSTIIYSYQTEGLAVFFRGLAPTLIRALPVNMATFAVFEGVIHAFG